MGSNYFFVGDDPCMLELSKLRDGELDIIFTVDLFNEGVDIPSVDVSN